MLISFSVSNFRSIGDEVTLNMVASNKLTDHPNHRVPIGDTDKFVLRTALIYGANAAGKSNLIKAMDVAQRLIRESRNRRAIVTPFHFRPTEFKDKPSSFEFRFLIGMHVFIYGFDIRIDKIISEWLCVLDGDEEVELFERDNEGKTTASGKAKKYFPYDDTTFSTLAAMTSLPIRNDQLFLTRALELPDEILGETLRSVLRWFTTDLIVLPANSRSSEILERLSVDPTFKKFCATFLSNVGTGVGDFDFELKEREVTNEAERRFYLDSKNRQRFVGGDIDFVPKPDSPGVVVERRLLSEHYVSDDKFKLPFSEESDGTQTLLHLLPALASPPEESHVIVLDELDRSLHPLLCWEFVRFFSEACEGSPRQLIVTTHEAHLLNQELLRRDEYWFAEKDKQQQTKLVSLLDFNIRNDLKIEKGYLAGRFGAIPFIGGQSHLEDLLNCTEVEDDDAPDKTST